MAEANAVRASRRWIELDGLRGIALLLVWLGHAAIPGFGAGFFGVDIFFALSGFLITGVLLADKAKHGRVRFGNFYKRRALRLLPALAVVSLAAVLYCEIHRNPLTQPTLSGIPYVWGYVANWRAAHGVGLGLLTHTWSLSIEEQFYWIWPVMLFLALKTGVSRRILAYVTFGLATAVMAWRGFALDHHIIGLGITYYRTDTHCDGLLLGCALALFLSVPMKRTVRGWQAGGLAVGGFALISAAMYEAVVPFSSWWYEMGSYYLVSLGAVAVMFAVVTAPPRWLTRMLAQRQLAYVGVISYGLYLWHRVIIQVLGGNQWLTSHIWIFRVLAFAVPLAVAAACYRWVERPFLRLKERGSIDRVRQPITADTKADVSSRRHDPVGANLNLT